MTEKAMFRLNSPTPARRDEALPRDYRGFLKTSPEGKKTPEFDSNVKR
jgi:hypothetical protein